MNRIFSIAGVYIALIFVVSPAWAADLSKPLKEIRIKGAVRADKNTVRFYIKSKVGELYTPSTVQNDIKKIYNLGFFDDVQVEIKEEPDGLVLIYVFREKPFVREIILSGAEEVQEKIINAKIKTKKGTFFRQDQIPWDENRIKKEYRKKGFYFTEVNTIVRKLGNNQVDVEYSIDEGSKILVGKIIFKGVSAFSPQTLESIMETKTAKWTSSFGDSGTYKRDTLRADLLRLESFYHDNGYIQVKIKDPEVEVDKEKSKIYVTFHIFEGDQYHVGAITTVGDEVYTEAQLQERVTLKSGDVFNRSKFRADIFAISDLYSQRGYAFANVTPKIDMVEEEKVVNVAVGVQKGQKVYIGRIIISGNEKTRDRVIRRQFLLQEGELYNSEKLRRSRLHINKLSLFESVEIEQRSTGENDLVDIEVKLVERQTGQFTFAVGYSSVENVVVQAQLKWMNLFGRGQELSLGVDTSSRRNDLSMSFTEPALFDRKLSGGIDLYNKEYEFDAFTSRNIGGSLRLGRGVGEFTWVKAGYKYEKNDVEIINEEDASVYLLDQEGLRTTGSVFPSITYDTRNDPFSPSAGKKIYGYLEIAGLGGDEKFYKMIGEYTQYYDLFFDFVAMGHLKMGRAEGYGGKEIPLYERFFMGGPRSLRGFTIGDIGPLDSNGEAIGGEALLQLNIELQYRFTRFFRGFLFYDRGNIYGKYDEKNNTTDDYYNLSEMRHSWGFGIHMFSPVGPISLVWGFKLDQRESESPSEFHFTIGGAF